MMRDTDRYCLYCGRIEHRCKCFEAESRLYQFFARAERVPTPEFRASPYKRGVPPQIKKRERANMRRHYKNWYTELIAECGEQCVNCGSNEAVVIDHIVPIAKGGLSELNNLQLLCAECNRIKGKLVIGCRPEDW